MKCATVGCQNTATEQISYRYRGASVRVFDNVCTDCADSYARRPVLSGFVRDLLPPIADPFAGIPVPDDKPF